MVHQNYGQNFIVFAKRFKGTVSQDGFGFCWLLMTCIVLGLIRGRDVFNFFRCFNDFYNAESVFLTVNASLHWLVCWRVLSPGFLASYWSLVSRVWDISSGIGLCFPLAGGLCKLYSTSTPEENNKYKPNPAR